MPKVTLQQVFDAAWQHFIVEGHEPCVRLRKRKDGAEFYGCSYHSPDGTNKCAIGLVISDEAAEVGDEAGLTAYDLEELRKHYEAFARTWRLTVPGGVK